MYNVNGDIVPSRKLLVVYLKAAKSVSLILDSLNPVNSLYIAQNQAIKQNLISLYVNGLHKTMKIFITITL